jgi:hypothetical protein
MCISTAVPNVGEAILTFFFLCECAEHAMWNLCGSIMAPLRLIMALSSPFNHDVFAVRS